MPNIVYKTMGFKCLIQATCPASAFVSADRNEARNPKRFIYATVVANFGEQNPLTLTFTKNWYFCKNLRNEKYINIIRELF